MKKFISALSSLVIAATALGGTVAMNATAAINGNVDSTLFDIQSNGKNEIEAKAGDVVPFAMYIPKSKGFHTVSLKFAINGDKTKGQDPSLCNDVTKYTLKKDTKLGSKGTTITHPEIFGNYGIEMTDLDFSVPGALYSGAVEQDDTAAGDPHWEQYAICSKENYNVLYVNNTCLSDGKNVDSYNAYEAANPSSYANYTPAYTWDGTDDWAYSHAFLEGALKLPANLPDGVYVFDIYTGNYVGSQFLEDFKTKSGDEFVDDPMNGSPVYVHSSVGSIAENESAFTSKALTIKVGNPTVTETTTSTTKKQDTTTTETQTKANPTTGLTYDLIPSGKNYTFDGKNNVVEAEPGETIGVQWIVTNDAAEVGGLEFTFDTSKVASVANVKRGNAYTINPNINFDKEGQVTYVFATDKIFHAKDGAVIMNMDVTVPSAKGNYTIGLLDGENQISAGHEKGSVNEYTFHGITFKVGESTGTTTTEWVTTTTETQTKANPTDGLTYDLVPASKEYTFDGKNNVVKATPGEVVAVQWIVTNDAAEVGGLEFTFDTSKVAAVANVKRGNAYTINPNINFDKEGQVTYVFATDKIFHAKDGAVIMNMDVTVPSAKGNYTIGLLDGENQISAGHEKGSVNAYTFHGITFDVDETVTTTTETTTTVTTTTETTTTVTTTTETTTTTTETTQPTGDVLWGDTNCDKKVSIADVVLLNKSLAGAAKLSPQGAKNADVQFDGNLNATDSKVIKGYLALLIEYKVMGTATAETTLDAAIAAQK